MIDREPMLEAAPGPPAPILSFVTNAGGGPVRGVTALARIGQRLRHESGGNRDWNLRESRIEVFNPGGCVALDALATGAEQGGERPYVVVVGHPDVDVDEDETGCGTSRSGALLEPDLATGIAGPEIRDA